MKKHRRKSSYRKIAVAAAAIAAVGMPSAAIACVDWQGDKGDKGGKPDDRRESASYDRWEKPSQDRWEKLSPDLWGKGRPAPEKTTAPPQTSPTTPSTGSPSTGSPSAPSTGATGRVVELVNAERSKAGCAPLTVNEKLTKAAQAHSEDMAGHRNMSHTGSDGSSPGDRIERAGYDARSYGENVAYGYNSPEKVMAGWMSSPGHKRNILDCGFKEIGVGLAQPGNYWTQSFGSAR